MKITMILIISSFLFFACDIHNLELKKEFYSNGNLKNIHYEDSNGDWQGECRIYFESGELEQIKNYKDDNLNGKYLLFDKSGNLRTISKFKNEKEIDTTFVYRDNGILERYSIYNKNSQDLKDVFFFPNGKIEKVRTFFIGTGQINAFKSFNEDGKINTKYGSSKFVTFKNIGDSILIKLYGIQIKKIDSIVISVLKNFDFDYINVFPQVIRHKTFLQDKSLKFKILNSDYLLNKVFLLIEVFSLKEGYSHVQPFHVQFKKAQKTPKDNIYPIYLK